MDKDKIFIEAYHKTIAEAERIEWRKNREDKIKVLAEMFESDLRRKDLTPREVQNLVKRFKDHIHLEDIRLGRRSAKVKKSLKVGIISAIVVAFVAGLVFFNSYRPLTPIEEVEAELDHYIEKVDAGMGAYSEKFYDTLDTYDKKLGEAKTETYLESMHDELEENFQRVLSELEQGNIRFRDDAKEWASYFPDKEERDARKEAVDNAFSEGMGKAFDEGVDKLVKGTGNVLQKAVDFIKKESKPFLD